MATVKFTKVELARLKAKLVLYERYLPTLQLKKGLLQMQVDKAAKEIEVLQRQWTKEKNLIKGYAKLLSDYAVTDCEQSLKIKEVNVGWDNIAGIEVPHLKEIFFEENRNMLMYQPLWVDDMISVLRTLRKAQEKVRLAKEKKTILERELRIISIRVNLFEKRLIPELKSDIAKVKTFLGDQDLQAVAQAKVSKKKSIQKREELESIA